MKRLFALAVVHLLLLAAPGVAQQPEVAIKKTQADTLRLLLPEAAGKIKLPTIAEPSMELKPAN